jgi:hypothetical protein
LPTPPKGSLVWPAWNKVALTVTPPELYIMRVKITNIHEPRVVQNALLVCLALGEHIQSQRLFAAIHIVDCLVKGLDRHNLYE